MATKEENSIGFRIVRAFNAKDLKEIAQIIGENYSSLHNWTAKRRDFPTNVLIKIANMANVSIDWILTGEDRKEIISSADQSFEKVLENKIREVVREEIANGAAIHEKIQGIILAMQPNLNEQNVFETTSDKEEKAA
jgi:Bacteriophage CI repressor helix-turn-helix domain